VVGATTYVRMHGSMFVRDGVRREINLRGYNFGRQSWRLDELREP